jgi:GT2 family glycosyltransferase
LKSLSRIDRKNLDVHIIVVDDGSTDGTSEAINENYPEVEIVKGDGNLWYTAGTNLCIKTALKHKPDYILAVNDDSVFDEKFLRNMVECAEKYPRSVIGALLLLWDEPHRVFQVSPQWNVWQGGWRHWVQQTVWTIPQKPWEVEIIVGNCVLYPRQVIEEVGLMNEKKLDQYGDAEYTPRMRKKGWRLLIEPRARVFCQPNDPHEKVLSMPFRKKIKVLFSNRKSSHNLFYRYNFYVYSAPTALEGFAAYWIFFARWTWDKITRKSEKFTQNEPKLESIVTSSVVKD